VTALDAFLSSSVVHILLTVIVIQGVHAALLWWLYNRQLAEADRERAENAKLRNRLSGVRISRDALKARVGYLEGVLMWTNPKGQPAAPVAGWFDEN